ncbi:helix-turn-helix domain-containing protein [Herbidospora sp. NBRC 101105]|uniref:helix-turn-helix domain-containing protein n=1 Tax=Herbidospora sp. NBRC 101105 TaxID=3032195 RepID=UPI00333C985A
MGCASARTRPRKGRRRYCERGIEGSADAPRPGRPRVFSARVVDEVKALACELPASSGTPLSARLIADKAKRGLSREREGRSRSQGARATRSTSDVGSAKRAGGA